MLCRKQGNADAFEWLVTGIGNGAAKDLLPKRWKWKEQEYNKVKLVHKAAVWLVCNADNGNAFAIAQGNANGLNDTLSFKQKRNQQLLSGGWLMYKRETEHKGTEWEGNWRDDTELQMDTML